MNILINFIIISLFILLILYIKLPLLTDDNVILNKFILFIGIFALEIIILSFDKISRDCSTTNIVKDCGCSKKIIDIIKEAVKVALLSVIGYSIYIDIVVFPKYFNLFNNIINSPIYHKIFLTLTISSFILISKMIDKMFLSSC